MQPQDVGDCLQIGALQAAAGRIVRRVEDQQPRLLRDLGLELVRVEGEIARFAQVNRHRHRAVGDDLRLVDRKSGHRIDHLVIRAMIGDRRDRVGDEGLRACADHDLVGRDVESAARAHVARRCGAQLVDAGGRRIAVLAGANRRDRRVLDIDRRREVGLADAERDDVAALANEVVDFGEHDECVLGAERFAATADARNDVRRVHLRVFST